jgi:hypothetical protein
MALPTDVSLERRAGELTEEIGNEIRKWVALTVAWLLVYIGVIVATVVFPVIVASKDGLAKSVLGDIGPYVPVLAAITAIVVAVDQLVHFQNVWLWSGSDRDDARKLRRKIKTDPPITQDALNAYRKQWDELIDLHKTHRVGWRRVETKSQ